MWFKQKLTPELQSDKQIKFYLVKQHMNLHCHEILAMIKQTEEQIAENSNSSKQTRAGG